jgi:intracellular septation protein A
MSEAAEPVDADLAVVEETVEDGEFHIPEVSARSILLGSGPRFARDAFGPMLVFYAGYKLSGLLVGIGLSTVASLVAYRWERNHDRPGLMARIGLMIVIVQAVIGVVSDSPVVYLAQPVLINGAYGLAFIGSALIGRPLAGAFATEMYAFPDEVKSSVTFRHAFRNVSLAWGSYLVLRSVVRLATLSNGDVDAFIVVNLLTGVPFTALLMSWSVWYAVRFFRNSEEWGEAIRLIEAAA